VRSGNYDVLDIERTVKENNTKENNLRRVDLNFEVSASEEYNLLEKSSPKTLTIVEKKLSVGCTMYAGYFE